MKGVFNIKSRSVKSGSDIMLNKKKHKNKKEES
jgi:hypothetical protein